MWFLVFDLCTQFITLIYIFFSNGGTQLKGDLKVYDTYEAVLSSLLAGSKFTFQGGLCVIYGVEQKVSYGNHMPDLICTVKGQHPKIPLEIPVGIYGKWACKLMAWLYKLYYN